MKANFFSRDVDFDACLKSHTVLLKISEKSNPTYRLLFTDHFYFRRDKEGLKTLP